MSQESAYRQTIQPLPRPLAHAEVGAEEPDELLEVAAIGDDGVGRNVAFFGEVGKEVLHRRRSRVDFSGCVRELLPGHAWAVSVPWMLCASTHN